MSNPARAYPFAKAPSARWADYLELTKPRLNFLVVVTTIVGYAMASQGHINWLIFLDTLIGTTLTAAGASALNQCIERDHDARMSRTSRRPIPTGRVSPEESLYFGISLALIGTVHLLLFVNTLTALLGVATLSSYVLIYTPLKRTSSLCTLVGAIPGAIPPVMGWTASTGVLSAESAALFAILFLWQMPHFLAIAILYRDDYAAAGFRMLPVIDPALHATARQILLYTLALIPISLTPAFLNMTGPIYPPIALLLGVVFLAFAATCARRKQRPDARRLFLASIIYLPLLLTIMLIGKL